MVRWLIPAIVLGLAAAIPIEPNDDIKTVYVVQSCHLDIGFADTAANIVNRYFDHFFLEAAATSEELRAAGGEERLVFTTHSYLISLYFDCPLGLGIHCPNATAKATVTKALQQGDLVMHAFPFNAEPEVMGVSLFNASLELTNKIADGLGIPRPRTFSQRDVPGFTRSSIPLLTKNGVEAVSVGVNRASLPPAVPKAFVWRDEFSKSQVLAMWHPFGYGGIDLDSCVMVDGLDSAFAFAWREDNQGPPAAKEVRDNWATLRKEFPGAKIVAAPFDAFVDQLKTVQDKLPVITGEIGDTWIYGVPSDPYKVAAFNVMKEARTWCESASATECDPTDARFVNFTRFVLKNSEHTWGMDVKTFLHDDVNWTNAKFQAASGGDNYKTLVGSWVEQRAWGLDAALEALGDHPAAARVAYGLAALVPQQPDLTGFHPVDNPYAQTFIVNDTAIGFDLTGAINALETAGVPVFVWRDRRVGQLVYQTLDTDDYTAFFNDYAQRQDGKVPSYFPMDFGKPNMSLAAPQHSTVSPSLVTLYTNFTEQGENPDPVGFIAHVTFPSNVTADAGAPASAWIEYTLYHDHQVAVRVLLFNKTATRLPEALWWVVNPETTLQGDWSMQVLGEAVNPLDVVVNGSRHLHAAPSISLSGNDRSPGFTVTSQDALIVTFGPPNPFPTPRTEPDIEQGAAYCLFNNIWGTNYIMWYPFLEANKDILYRFNLIF